MALSRSENGVDEFALRVFHDGQIKFSRWNYAKSIENLEFLSWKVNKKSFTTAKFKMASLKKKERERIDRETEQR